MDTPRGLFLRYAFRLGNKTTAQVAKPCAAITSIRQEEIRDTDFFIRPSWQIVR